MIAIVGPTAAGKTDLALRAASGRPVEVVNADAFCLYRGMDIGTAKPTPEDRATVPHHLFDVLDIEEPAQVAAYQRAARRVIGEISARGRTPVVVGGSGLYVDAVLGDLRFPGTDPALRRGLERRLAAEGADALHAELTLVDPAAAAAILPTNGRRIVRALEVNRMTGGPFRATLSGMAPWCPAVWIGLDPGVEPLDEAIAERVAAMWAAGLVGEVGALEERLRRAPTAGRAVGYRQVLDLLSGALDDQQAFAGTVAATRKLARRQRAWFRRGARVQWFANAEQAADFVDRLEP